MGASGKPWSERVRAAVRPHSPSLGRSVHLAVVALEERRVLALGSRMMMARNAPRAPPPRICARQRAVLSRHPWPRRPIRIVQGAAEGGMEGRPTSSRTRARHGCQLEVSAGHFSHRLVSGRWSFIRGKTPMERGRVELRIVGPKPRLDIFAHGSDFGQLFLFGNSALGLISGAPIS